MTWTLDRTTDTGKVRVLVTGEAVEASAVFEDEDIAVFLSLEGDSVYRAAALALERIAGDQALLLRKAHDANPAADNLLGGVMSLDVGSIKLDAKGAADAFLKLAARYRAVADTTADGAEDDIGWAGMVLNGWGEREALWNDARRRLP